MRAIRFDRFGGPEVLHAVDVPSPPVGPGQLRVRVRAAGVNFIDTYQRAGRYPVPLPFVAGSEGAGEVAGTGERVAWAGVPGSYAEEIAAPADRLVPVPAGVDLDVAAAVMLQGMTAHYLTHA